MKNVTLFHKFNNKCREEAHTKVCWVSSSISVFFTTTAAFVLLLVDNSRPVDVVFCF